jgi:hypothetical protein
LEMSMLMSKILLSWSNRDLLIVLVGTTVMWLDLVEDPLIVVVRSLDEIGLALWRQYSSWFSLVEF